MPHIIMSIDKDAFMTAPVRVHTDRTGGWCTVWLSDDLALTSHWMNLADVFRHLAERIDAAMTAGSVGAPADAAGGEVGD